MGGSTTLELGDNPFTEPIPMPRPVHTKLFDDYDRTIPYESLFQTN